MRYLKRQFGASFVQALAKSPTLVSNLSACRRRGITIHAIRGKSDGFSIPSKKLIAVGTSGTRISRLVNLAHEMYHILYGSAPVERVPKGMTRRCFIKLLLEEETDCFVHEMKVVDELLAAGVPIDGVSRKWYRRWKRGGRKAIREKVLDSDTFVTGDFYPEYYGQIYDKATGQPEAS